MREKPVILLIGESGSGKNTVQDILEQQYGLKPLLSYTTRPKRNKEENTHTFVSEVEFNHIIDTEQVIAFTRYNDYRYCATSNQIAESDVYIIDMGGFYSLKEAKINGKIDFPFVSFYLKVPEQERVQRMKSRGDSAKAIRERIEYDKNAFEFAEELCSYTIENIDSSMTARQIYNQVYGATNDSADISAEREKIYEVEKETLDKLCQVQTLMKMLHPDIDYINIEINNCKEYMPLEISESGNNIEVWGHNENGDVVINYSTIDNSNKKLLRNLKFVGKDGNLQYIPSIQVR
jgi:guanylate kinase